MRESVKYKRIYCGFDIETTNMPNKHAYMYHWQLAVNSEYYYGRTWDTFIECYNMLVKRFEPSKNERILIWVHNLSFEFSFIKNRFKWAKDTDKNGICKPLIFALDDRKIVYAVTNDFVEFRDSAVLTGMTLSKLAKTYCKTQKLVGDLDFKKIRNSKTILNENEKAYCKNDVVILSEFAEFIFKYYGDDIPLTKTAIVRNKLKFSFKQLDKTYRSAYSKKIMQAFPDEEQYKNWFRWLYRGGWVHCNFELSGVDIIEVMKSFDFKSSYPSVCFDKMPYRFKVCKPCINSINWVLDDINNRAMILHVKIYNLKRSTCHSIFSKHKTYIEDNAICATDNGRISFCSECEMLLTEFDYLDLINFYEFENIEFLQMSYSIKEYLPKFMLDLIYECFEKKETATGLDRILAKTDLNSIYGMCVTSIILNDNIYNEKTGLFEPSKECNNYNSMKFKQILLPQWGIWISAKARHNLLSIVYKITLNSDITSDAVYGDTDSIKLRNVWKHKHIIEEYNNNIMRRNNEIYNLLGYNIKNLGCFTDEGNIYRFKTLGCKRYIYDVKGDNGLETHITIAGMPKNALNEALKCKKFDIYKVFRNGMELPAYMSGKLTTKYNDEKHCDIVDGEYMEELSSVALYNIPFKMKIELEYLELINSIKHKKKLFRERGQA